MDFSKHSMFSPLFRFHKVVLVGCLTSLIGISAGCLINNYPNVKVQFVNPKTGWIIGPQLLHTSDGGKTWEILQSNNVGTVVVEGIGYGHKAIQFIDPNVGVHLKGYAIWKTVDGGKTWMETSILPASEKQSIPPMSLFFISPNVGWVVGEFIYSTSDGGNSWKQLSRTPEGNKEKQNALHVSPLVASHMPSLWFFNATLGLMARLDGEIYLTEDGGKSWNHSWSINQRINDIHFIDGNTGWLVGSRGVIARTDDGGRSWTIVQTSITSNLNGVYFFSQKAGCVVGDKGTIECTKDRGQTWKSGYIQKASAQNSPLASISFTDTNHGWVVGGEGEAMELSLSTPSNIILTTEDGGDSWK